MTDYQVRCHKRVVDSPSSFGGMDVTLERVLTLPFPPTVGLFLTDGDFECKVLELAWDLRAGEFQVWGDEDLERANELRYQDDHRDRPKHEVPTTCALAAEWLASGWTWPTRDVDEARQYLFEARVRIGAG